MLGRYCHDGIDDTCGTCGEGYPTRQQDKKCVAGAPKPAPSPGATPTVCNGGNPDPSGCCTHDTPCGRGEGQCENDAGCRTGLLCGDQVR